MNRFCTILAACSLALGAMSVGSEELSIPGSGNAEFVLTELAKGFNQSQDRHRVTVPSSTGTAGAIRDVLQGSASLGRVGRPLKDEERGKGLVFVPLGYDPVVFVAGAGVATRNITAAQAYDAFTGKITDWRELGGKPGPIRAIGREATDASLQAIARHLKPFAAIQFHDNAKLVHLDPQLIELLDRYPTSLGFLNRSQLSAARTKVVLLALDGVEPTPANMAAGRYPMWLEFGLIHTPGSLTKAAREFLKFIESPAGSRILDNHGIVRARPSQ